MHICNRCPILAVELGALLYSQHPFFICPSTRFPEKSHWDKLNPEHSVFLWFGSACASDWERTGVFTSCDAQQHTGAIDPTSTGARSAEYEIWALLRQTNFIKMTLSLTSACEGWYFEVGVAPPWKLSGVGFQVFNCSCSVWAREKDNKPLLQAAMM